MGLRDCSLSLNAAANLRRKIYTELLNAAANLRRKIYTEQLNAAANLRSKIYTELLNAAANLRRKIYTELLNAAAVWLHPAVMNFDVFPNYISHRNYHTAGIVIQNLY